MKKCVRRPLFEIFLFSLFLICFVFSGNSISFAEDTIDILGSVVISDKDGNIKADHSGIVVFIDAMEYPSEVILPDENPQMRQANKTYAPSILPVVVGTTVEIPNDDTISHNSFSLSSAKKFDLGIYGKGESKDVTFDKIGLATIYCNIHPQMIGYILVLANNHFAVTDANGNFELPNVPYGDAVIRTWHGRGRVYPEKEVFIGEDGVEDADSKILDTLYFEIKESVVSLEHKNKNGKFYSTKY